MATLQKELQEFANQLTTPLQQGESWYDRANQAVRELSDILGHLLDAVDEENRDEEVAQLKRDAFSILEATLDRSGTRIPFMVRAVVPAVVSSAIEACVDGGVVLDDLMLQHVVPKLQQHQETIQRIIDNLERK